MRAGRDLLAYTDSLVDSGIAQIPMTDAQYEKLPRYQGDADAHLKLLDYGRKVLKQIANDPRVQLASSPTVFHPDLHNEICSCPKVIQLRSQASSTGNQQA